MKVLLSNNFSIVNQCNCYQICYRKSNFVTISRDMQYFGLETFRGYKIFRKWSNREIAKLSTREI